MAAGSPVSTAGGNLGAHVADAPAAISTATCQVSVATELDCLFETGGLWDQLVARSSSNTLFVKSGWLRAWRATLGADAALVIVQIAHRGSLIAAAAFQHDGGVVEFAGKGPSDYADFIIANDCTDAAAAITLLLDAAVNATPGFRHFVLGRFPPTSESVGRLRGLRGTFHATVVEGVPCPRMAMSAVGATLRKKRMRRIERLLQQQGALVCDTYIRAHDVEPLLEAFFDQHVRRWASTDTPSLFVDANRRSFYRAVVRELDSSGELRFSVLRLDGRLVAAHFGFRCAGDFLLYKPAYEPAFGEFSPGLVLLMRLFERARDEGAAVFDFTIGQEAYKLRFATEIPNAHIVHVTNSRLLAAQRRAQLRVRDGLRSIVGEGATKRAGRLLGRNRV